MPSLEVCEASFEYRGHSVSITARCLDAGWCWTALVDGSIRLEDDCAQVESSALALHLGKMQVIRMIGGDSTGIW